jgi:6-phosphogluconate dehydrogenase
MNAQASQTASRQETQSMKIAMVGLGRMGGNMARRLMQKGHQVVAFDVGKANVDALVRDGAQGAYTLAEMVKQLPSPRVVWLMVPSGEITEKTVHDVSALLSGGDILIDGGNSFYKDDVRRARELAKKGIHYVDVGTSGGVWGIERGYCLMIGAERTAFEVIAPILRALAPGRGDVPATPGREKRASTAEEGFVHCGPVGAGHFVKMIHNGIEYGLMQAYAEGLDILRGADQESLPPEHRYQFDLAEITEVWRRGSVIGSWLLDLTAMALAESPDLAEYAGHVADSGEGRWTVNAAIEEAVPAEVLTSALYTRFRSREDHSFAEKVLSAMRKKFGGHVESKR